MSRSEDAAAEFAAALSRSSFRHDPTERAEAGASAGKVELDYAAVRAFFEWIDSALSLHAAGARAQANQSDARTARIDVDDDKDAPDNGDALIELVRRAHALLLEHPIAAKAAGVALAREGRRFAKTPEGAELDHRLRHSRRIRRATLLWRALTQGMLDDPSTGLLPSHYLDALIRVADREDLEQLVSLAQRMPR